MIIKKGFVLREVAGTTMAIATGEASKSFQGMIKLNSTAKVIWEGIDQGLTEQEIAAKIASGQQVDFDEVLSDVKQMVSQMREAGFLCE